jgi:tetratricopeptide (TPR) repeat protein
VAALAAATANAFLRPARSDARPFLAAQQNGGDSRVLGLRALGFAGVWFFAILAPTSLVPGVTQTIVEHRMYLALAPLMAALVLGADAALQACRTEAGRGRTTPAYLIPAGALAVAVVFAGLTSFRNRDYCSALALWGDTARKSPDNPYAQNNLGIALIDAGRLAEAAACFEETVRLKPDYAEAYNNLGLAEAGLGRDGGDRRLREGSAPEAELSRGACQLGSRARQHRPQ